MWYSVFLMECLTINPLLVMKVALQNQGSLWPEYCGDSNLRPPRALCLWRRLHCGLAPSFLNLDSWSGELPTFNFWLRKLTDSSSSPWRPRKGIKSNQYSLKPKPYFSQRKNLAESTLCPSWKYLLCKPLYALILDANSFLPLVVPQGGGSKWMLSF